MQYSLQYATLLLVAFSLSLASTSWLPPIGPGLALIALIVGVRLVWNPPWLRWTVWAAVWGAVVFAAVCFAGGSLSGEYPLQHRYAPSNRWEEIARRYAIPFGGIAGGAAGHALFVRSSKQEREKGET